MSKERRILRPCQTSFNSYLFRYLLPFLRKLIVVLLSRTKVNYRGSPFLMNVLYK